MIYKTSFDIPIKLSTKSTQEIVDFYLFNCPVPGKSTRGKKFSDYGWNGSKSFSTLKKSMLSSAGSKLDCYYFPCTSKELPEKFKIVHGLIPPQEYCVFLKSDENSVMQSLYGAIRNSFAHGSFTVHSYNKIRIYYFENYNNYLKAKIALHELTLLKWIKIVKNESRGQVP